MAIRSDTQNTVKPIRFIRRGEVVTLANVPPSRTLLEVLREDLACTGTKEGCGEGDCGACTVVLGEADGKTIRYRAINSCIRLAHSIDGLALWTVEDIAPTLFTSPSASCNALPPEGALRLRPGKAGSAAPTGEEERGKPTLHPAQEAMVQFHGSQCGFCTPGFVMSLFGMYHNHVGRGQPITRALAQEELSGNLCRCTGYRPILDAAQAMDQLPQVAVDEAGLLKKMKQLAHAPYRPGPDFSSDFSYESPPTLAALLKARAAHPEAQLVAGCTDVGLWVTKQHQQFSRVLDVTRVRELRRIEDYPQHIAIGAAVTLADAYAALAKDRPQLHTFAARFAGLPVRNAGTMGGNVANGSPIGDSMPLLIALGANVVLMNERQGVMGHREMPLEQLYTGYRQSVMAPDEVLAWVKVPRPASPHPNPLPGGEGIEEKDGIAPSPLWGEGWGEGQELLRIYKISKRYDDDISAVCLALNLHIDKGIVTSASIGAGGVAATPVRAVKTEAALLGQAWTAETVQQAITTLRAEFSPISDMRASAAYRSTVLGNLLQRYWLESQGLQQINLESFRLEELA
ncbi:xanthine dehydrogenase small subunit [Polaromonas sp. JS666]|uniref:xanthine dehydrogenase small subunit n=1 Tax=Polaromonas sp. (strain JS666 / ATCC BAA-500) TaxID=296591 RepID=UPI0000464BEE|nr:FAD binding domain-containing protein [Polaromonas sp. JS666]ABE43429.1 molybdopterin dehydrogenase, FAD-binding protein [Polaromonas sp. JS666]